MTDRSAHHPAGAAAGIARLVLLVVGIVAFVWLLVDIGPRAVAHSLHSLSWWLLLLVWFPALPAILLEVAAWRYAFSRDRVPFRELVRARLVGDAFNGTTPTGSVGGEAIKAWLIRPWVSTRESVPSLLIAKTSDVAGQAFVQGVGLAVAWAIMPRDAWLVRVLLWTLGLQVLAIGGFVFVQVGGAVARGSHALRRLGLLAARAAGAGALRVDRALARYYRRQHGRLALSLLCSVGSLLATILETYLILLGLGTAGASLASAAVLTAAGWAAIFAGFLVPAHIGIQEGGFAAAAVALGMPAEVGLTVSLVKRLRDVLWYGIGFALFAHDRRRSGAQWRGAVNEVDRLGTT